LLISGTFALLPPNPRILKINTSQQVDRLQAEQSNHGQLISSSLQATQDLSQTILKQMDQSARWQAKVIDAIHGDHRYHNHIWDVEAFLVSTEDQFYRGYAERFRNNLLVRLQYIDMERRSEGVSDAHDETFRWVFSRLSVENQKWSNFIHFLESDQGLYWITGKPSAGKSTLMKFLHKSCETAHHLQTWASGKTLHMSDFYFWCSGGSEIHMTQKGFYGLYYTRLCEPFLT
jgi:hypothetical protein